MAVGLDDLFFPGWGFSELAGGTRWEERGREDGRREGGKAGRRRGEEEGGGKICCSNGSNTSINN